MFRTMRRIRQQLPEEECRKILEEATSGVLSLSGDDGYPYGVPVSFALSGDRLVFHCAREGHKLDAIRRNDRVSLCVIARDDVHPETLSTLYTSVIVFGRARILEDRQEILDAAWAVGKKFSGDWPEAIEKEIEDTFYRLCCVEITIEHMTGKEARELMEARVRREKEGQDG